MNSDYKYDAQMRAEEMAQDEFGPDTEWSDLSPEQRDRLYTRGEQAATERLFERADWLRDRAKEQRDA
jgi:hypothetical protein